MSEVNALVVKYGETEFDVSKLPVQSIRALVKRGLAHYLGNEQSSKVTAYKAKLAAGSEGVPGREATEEELEQKKAELNAAAIKAIFDGEIGAGTSRGPSRDPLEVAREYFAKQRVLATLKAHGIKAPKGDETIEFAGGVTRTMAQMIAGKLAKEGPEIEKEAVRKVKDDKARAEAAKAKAKTSEGPVDAEALGL